MVCLLLLIRNPAMQHQQSVLMTVSMHQVYCNLHAWMSSSGASSTNNHAHVAHQAVDAYEKVHAIRHDSPCWVPADLPCNASDGLPQSVNTDYTRFDMVNRVLEDSLECRRHVSHAH